MGFYFVIARSVATKQSRTSVAGLDCFAEPVIGPATSGRTRWLAMTKGDHAASLGQAETPLHPNPLPARGERGLPGITMRDRDRQIFAIAAYSAFTALY